MSACFQVVFFPVLIGLPSSLLFLDFPKRDTTCFPAPGLCKRKGRPGLAWSSALGALLWGRGCTSPAGRSRGFCCSSEPGFRGSKKRSERPQPGHVFSEGKPRGLADHESHSAVPGLALGLTRVQSPSPGVVQLGLRPGHRDSRATHVSCTQQRCLLSSCHGLGSWEAGAEAELGCMSLVGVSTCERKGGNRSRWWQGRGAAPQTPQSLDPGHLWNQHDQ